MDKNSAAAAEFFFSTMSDPEKINDCRIKK